jgi:hypothetical protein
MQTVTKTGAITFISNKFLKVNLPPINGSMARLLLLMFLTDALGQSVSTRMGARPAALGKASLCLRDEAVLFNNVGALAWLDGPSAFFACEVTPALPGANRVAASIQVPTSIGVLAVGAFRFGDRLYSEQMLTAGFGHRIGSTSLGIKTSVVQYRADGFETRTAMTVDVGGLTRLTPAWTVAASLCNLTQASMAGETLPVILSTATSWHSDRLLVSAEVEKRLDAPAQVRGGVELALGQKLFIRTGFGFQPVQLSFGIGARARRLSVDFSTTYQRSFGFIHQASAGYTISQKKK